MVPAAPEPWASSAITPLRSASAGRSRPSRRPRPGISAPGPGAPSPRPAARSASTAPASQDTLSGPGAPTHVLRGHLPQRGCAAPGRPRPPSPPPGHARTPTRALPAKFVPGPAAARRPLTFGEQGGQADEHGGPVLPRRPHLRRAHPRDPGVSPPLSGAVRAKATGGRAPGGGRGAGRPGGARLGARAAAGPRAPLPPVHGRPHLLCRVRRARRQTPPPLSPTRGLSL